MVSLFKKQVLAILVQLREIIGITGWAGSIWRAE